MTPDDKNINISTDDYDAQDVVPDLMTKLSQARIEVLQNSNGPPLQFVRDPHLRLRRTFTPTKTKTATTAKHTGIPKYSEAQFVIHDTTGKRQTISFQAFVKCLDESSGGTSSSSSSIQMHDFYMDAYVFGASEHEAQLRLVAVHGISPTASRERWHTLGARIQQDSQLNKSVRLVALDWHSLDRGDAVAQQEFMTMLPKHYLTTPEGDLLEDMLDQWNQNGQENDTDLVCKDKMRALFEVTAQHCPRTFEEAAGVLKAAIQQGLGWGVPSHGGGGGGKSFVPCIKSWSGGVGMEMLFQANSDKRNKDLVPCFRDYIQAAIIMHPACFQTKEYVKQALDGNLPVLAAWSKDDPLVPYAMSQRFQEAHDDITLVTYESGGHGSFDGSTVPGGGQPNFDDEILKWMTDRFL